MRPARVPFPRKKLTLAVAWHSPQIPLVQVIERDLGLDRQVAALSWGARLRSNLQRLEIRDTLLREFPALLDKVVLDPACLRSSEGLHPIDGAFAHRNLRPAPSASPRPADSLATEPEPGRSCPRPADASS